MPTTVLNHRFQEQGFLTAALTTHEGRAVEVLGVEWKEAQSSMTQSEPRLHGQATVRVKGSAGLEERDLAVRFISCSEARLVRLLEMLRRARDLSGLPEIVYSFVDSSAHGKMPTSWVLVAGSEENALDFGDRTPDGVIEALAAVHAAFHQRRDTVDWLPRFFKQDLADLVGLAAQAVERVAEIPEINESLQEIQSHFWSRAWQHDRIWGVLAEAPFSVVRRDSQPSHLLQNGDGQVVIMNWSEAMYGPVVLDLPNMVQKEDAIRRYLPALHRMHGPVLQEVDFGRWYDAARLYVLLKYLPFPLWDVARGQITPRKAASWVRGVMEEFVYLFGEVLA